MSSLPVDIIVPVFNTPDLLRRCVNSLWGYVQHPYRLCIADDCSSSSALQFYLEDLEAMNIDIFRYRLHRIGVGEILNKVIEQSEAPLFCLLHSDTRSISDWLTPMAHEMKLHSNVGVVGALLLFPPEKPEPLSGSIQHAGVARNSKGVPYHIWRGHSGNISYAKRRREINAVSGACMLIRREAWNAVGGFDSQLFSGRFDIDFCYSARKLGWKVVYQPAATLLHHEQGSGKAFRYKFAAKAMARLAIKWSGLDSDEYLFKKGSGTPVKAPVKYKLKGVDLLAEAAREAMKSEISPEDAPIVYPQKEQNVRGALVIQGAEAKSLRELPLVSTPGMASLIVLNYNTLKVTADCIRSILFKTEYPYELIVVDNGSEDGSVEWLQRKSYLTLIKNGENLGWATGNNRGIRASKGEYCVLVNSDIIVRTRGWLGNMIRLAQSDDVATVGAKLLYPDGRIQHIGGSIHNTNPFHPFDGSPADIEVSLVSRDVPFNTGACLLIKKSAMKLIGLPDEGYHLGYADVDYGLKCLEEGLRNVYCSSAVLTHLWAYTQRKTSKWIPPVSLARFKQLWSKKIPSLAPVALMDFRWPGCANWVRKSGPGSHIVTIRNEEQERALSWGGVH